LCVSTPGSEKKQKDKRKVEVVHGSSFAEPLRLLNESQSKRSSPAREPVFAPRTTLIDMAKNNLKQTLTLACRFSSSSFSGLQKNRQTGGHGGPPLHLRQGYL